MPGVTSRSCPIATGSGFSLAELAVVLTIVSLLIGGLLVPLTAQVDLRAAHDTRQSLAEIREALLGYAAVKGRLPCPASATTASNVLGAGSEAFLDAGGLCPNAAGVLPWATLGVRETDAWGRRYSYRVTSVFAQCVAPPLLTYGTPCTAPSVSFVLTSLGDLQVRSVAGGSVIAQQVPAIVVSHGKNGNGAYTPQGTQLPVGTDADELDNQLTNVGASTANLDFVSKSPTPTFDDEVVWLSPGVLFNRMISVGRLP